MFPSEGKKEVSKPAVLLGKKLPRNIKTTESNKTDATKRYYAPDPSLPKR